MTDDPLRCTGRTTRLAAHYLKECLLHAGEWVTVEDHYDRGIAHRCLAARVGAFLDLLFVHHLTNGNRIMVVPIIGEKR